MTDETAKAARLMNVIEVMVAELEGVTETLAGLRFDPTPLAEASSRQRTAM